MSDNAPITEELRDAMKRYDNFDGTSRVVLGESNFDHLCDAIDATYADLERENSKLRELVWELWEGYTDPPCEDCPLKDKPACADCPICAREAAVVDRMRELGGRLTNERSERMADKSERVHRRHK